MVASLKGVGRGTYHVKVIASLNAELSEARRAGEEWKARLEQSKEETREQKEEARKQKAEAGKLKCRIQRFSVNCCRYGKND